MMLNAVLYCFDEGFIVQFKPSLRATDHGVKCVGWDVVCYRLEDVQCGHIPAFEFFHDTLVTPDESCAEFYYRACHEARI